MNLIKDFFTIERGNARNLNSKQNSNYPGSVRLISSSASKNGGSIFVEPEEGEKVFKNVLTINNNGSVGYVYWHPYSFVASSDVTILHLKENHLLNDLEALYLKAAIQKQKDQFQYGFKLSNQRLKNMKFFAPLRDLSKGYIDWDMINSQMKESMGLIDNKYLSTQKTLDTSLDLNDRIWKPFAIKSVLDIKSGKRLTKFDMVPGNTPFIGSSSKNNGLTGWVSNSNSSEDSNLLGINYNGSVVDNFYHPYKALFSDDVKRAHLKDENSIKNKYVYLFFKVVILQQKSSYQFGYKFNGKRMLNQKILLPVNEKEQPDYEFMENYIKSLPYGDII